MILSALNDYYARKPDLAPEGFELKAIPFVLVLDEAGQLIQLADRREGDEAKAVLVPQGVKKSMNIASNLLWGNAEYVLGLPDVKKLAERKAKHKEHEYKTRLLEMHTAFGKRIRTLSGDAINDIGICAVLAFLDRPLTNTLESLAAHPSWAEILETNPLMTFQLDADTELVCQRPAVISALISKESEVANGRCLVSGEPDVIERLHPPIKGVWGAQTSGANIVSINNKTSNGNDGGQTPAFASYGKQQGYNAPVGKRVAFSYTTALNHLLAKGSRQRVQVGDASTVFWAEKTSGELFEQAFLDFLNPQPDDPGRGTQAVASLYGSVKDGKPFTSDDDQRFYVLGLAPNAARIAIRFWHVATVAELALHIRQHFEDMAIVRSSYIQSPYLSIKTLLASLAQFTRDRPHGDIDKLPPNLAGDFMKAVLDGTPYPQPLLQAALRRVHAEQARKDDSGKHREHVTHPRASFIKAWLNRQTRNANQNQEREITMALDECNNNIGYRLGRLFAVLEKVQEEANPGLNTTIRDSYFGSASSTPGAVFSTLMRRNQHHMTKLRKEKPGLYVTRDRLIQSILYNGVDGGIGFPLILFLPDQGRFTIGYYHQRHAFFNKPDADAFNQSATEKE